MSIHVNENGSLKKLADDANSIMTTSGCIIPLHCTFHDNDFGYNMSTYPESIIKPKIKNIRAAGETDYFIIKHKIKTISLPFSPSILGVFQEGVIKRPNGTCRNTYTKAFDSSPNYTYKSPLWTAYQTRYVPISGSANTGFITQGDYCIIGYAKDPFTGNSSFFGSYAINIAIIFNLNGSNLDFYIITGVGNNITGSETSGDTAFTNLSSIYDYRFYQNITSTDTSIQENPVYAIIVP